MDQKYGLGEGLLPKQVVHNVLTYCKLHMTNNTGEGSMRYEIHNGFSPNEVITLSHSLFVIVSCNDIALWYPTTILEDVQQST
jgi:hypothetical protein